MAIVSKTSFTFLTEQIVDLTSKITATAAASNSAIIVSGEGVTKTIGLRLDGTTLSQTANGLKSNLTIAKQQSAESGFAATYYLTDGTNVIGEKINLIKDQFLKAVTLVDGDGQEHDGTTLVDGHKYLRFVFELTRGQSDSDTDSIVYLDVNDLYDSYSSGNGITVDNSNNTIAINIDQTSEAVTTAENTTVSVLTVGANGLKVNNIQAAIDYAVGVETSNRETAVSGEASAREAADTALSNRVTALEQGGSSRGLTTVSEVEAGDIVTANYTTTSVLQINIADPSEVYDIEFANFPVGGEMIVMVSTTSSKYTINGEDPEAQLSALADEFTNGVFRVTCTNATAGSEAYLIELLRFAVAEEEPAQAGE